MFTTTRGLDVATLPRVPFAKPTGSGFSTLRILRQTQRTKCNDYTEFVDPEWHEFVSI